MTFEEFLQAAQKLEDWYYTPLGMVRRDGVRSLECPLAAVANAVSASWQFGNWWGAARYLRIHPKTAKAIVRGADFGTGKYGAALQALVKDD